MCQREYRYGFPSTEIQNVKNCTKLADNISSNKPLLNKKLCHRCHIGSPLFQSVLCVIATRPDQGEINLIKIV